MSELLSRDNEIYKRIENFKEYEYTYCIAYEMMQRSFGEKCILKKDTKGYICKPIDISDIMLSSKCNLRDYIFNIFPSLYNDLLKQKNKESHNLTDEERIQFLNTPISLEYIIEHYINNGEKQFQNIFYEKSKNKMEELTKEKLIDIIKNEKKISRPILPDFAYESVVPKEHKFVALYNINLALPVKELVCYIEKIKKDFDTNNLILDTPIEILSEDYIKKELCTQEDSIQKRYGKIERFKKNGEKKSKMDVYSILKESKKVADMLYIYDNEYNNFNKPEIIQELITYHGKFDTDRYDNYLKIAEKFINDNAYKKLIT